MEQLIKKHIAHIMIFAAFFHVVTSHACLSNDDCLYGGVCDTVLRRCKCSLNCQRFTNPNVVCAEKKNPMMECTALVLACEMQENVVLTAFDQLLFKETKNCKKMVTKPKEEFCVDQSLCSGNGICLRRLDNSQSFCRCVDNYTGDRCTIKQPALMPVIKPETNTNGIIERILNADTVGTAGRMHPTDPVPYVTTAMIICAIAACVAIYFRRRFVRSGSTEKRENEKNDSGESLENNNHEEHSTHVIISLTSDNENGKVPDTSCEEKTGATEVEIVAGGNDKDKISEIENTTTNS